MTIGTGDTTICFHCWAGLQEWVEKASPLVEKGALSHFCVYVRYIKGPQVINDWRRRRDSFSTH